MITLFYKFSLFSEKNSVSPPFVALLPFCLEYCFGEFFTSQVRKFNAFLASRIFITIVTRSRQWYLLSQKNPVRVLFFLKFLWRYLPIIPAICSKYRPTTHLMLVDFISILIFGKEYYLWSFSISSCYPDFFGLWWSEILPSTLLSDNLNLRSCRSMRGTVSGFYIERVQL